MNQLKNWAIALVGVLALSINNGCGGEGDYGDEVGTVEQPIKLEQSGHFGTRDPGGLFLSGNELCVPNDANQTCYYPSSKAISIGVRQADFTANQLAALGTDIPIVRGILADASHFGATGTAGFSTSFNAGADPSVNLKFVADSTGINTSPAALLDRYVVVKCVSSVNLSEGIPGTYARCSSARAEINVSQLMADFPAAPDFNKEIKHAVGHAILAYAGLGSSPRNSAAGTYQARGHFSDGAGAFTAWQICELNQYLPTGSGYDGTGSTCLNF